MISVCMATYNGEKYIKGQIDSILCQLNPDDELVISDDGSSDRTIAIVEEFHDSRIKLLIHSGSHGVTRNFENALRNAKGEIIFLSDQDDVWLPGKVEQMSAFLETNHYDLVMSNCSMVDQDLQVIRPRYFDREFPIRKSVLGNLYKCSCLGCCLAFNRKALKAFLPFPSSIVLHDLWIFLFALSNFRCGFMDDVFLLYRRHNNTVSFAGFKSANSLFFKIKYRFFAFYFWLVRSVQYKLSGL